MSDTAAPFHYDIVGSFLRPEKLKTARLINTSRLPTDV